MRDITIFSGSAHRELAASICHHLGIPLAPSSLVRFANDCLEVQLHANCRERHVSPGARGQSPAVVSSTRMPSRSRT